LTCIQIFNGRTKWHGEIFFSNEFSRMGDPKKMKLREENPLNHQKGGVQSSSKKD